MLHCDNTAHDPDKAPPPAIVTIHLIGASDPRNVYAVCPAHLHSFVVDVVLYEELGPRVPFEVWPVVTDEQLTNSDLLFRALGDS